jgi:hypothetical protein
LTYVKYRHMGRLSGRDGRGLDAGAYATLVFIEHMDELHSVLNQFVNVGKVGVD